MLHFLFIFTLITILFCVFLYKNKNNKNLIYFVGLISSNITFLKQNIKTTIFNISQLYINLYSKIFEFLIEEFYLLLPFLILYSMFSNNCKLLIILSVLKVKEMILKTEFFSSLYSQFLIDQKAIESHWENDTDLILIKKISFFFIFFGFFICILSVIVLFIGLQDPQKLSSYKNLIFIIKQPHGFYLLSFGCLLRFLAETHIILYRNFPVSDKVVSQCVNCGKVALVLLSADTAMKIPMSFIPNAQPTAAGNFYQTHIGGRGYGFQTTRDGIHHTAFENLDPVKQGLVSIKKDFTTKGKYDFDKANAFAHLPENKEWAKKNMSIADCQNLGFSKNKSDLIPLPSYWPWSN